MSRKPLLILVTLAVAGALGGAFLWLRPPAPRVLLIGLDGIDWKIVDRLIDEGRLPNFQKLKSEGAYGPLMTLTDIPLSPVIWTSITTGKVAAKHNITWFLVDTPDGKRVPVRSYNRNAKALWNILAEQGLAPGVVGWWATAPAENVGDGAIISDAYGYHGFGSTGQGIDDALKSYPSELHSRYGTSVPPLQDIDYSFGQRFLNMSGKEYYGRSFKSGQSRGPNPARPVHLFQAYTATMEGYSKIATDLISSQHFDLFMVYFEATDSISHLFMKYASPRLPWIREEDYERYKDVVDNYYAYADEKVGELLETVDDDWLVVVLSDHGFRTGDRRPRSVKTVDVRGAHLDHEPEGVFIARGPNIGKGPVLEGASVLDVAPTLLHYLGLRIPTDMDGRVLKEIFEPDFLAEHPLEYIATYESPDGLAHSAPTGVDSSTEQDAAEALRALQTLGYVGGSANGGAGAGAGAGPGEGLSSPEQHNNLGRIHLGNGDVEGAIREFQKALELDPKNSEAHTNIGIAHMSRGRSGLALQSLTRALEANPNDIGVLQYLAELKIQANQLLDAEQLYRQALEVSDRLPGPYIGLGNVLQRLQRYPEARRILERAAELDPGSLAAHFNLGVVHERLGNADESRRAYLRALDINPNHSMTLNNLGHGARQEDKLDEARDYFERAAAADPAHVQSRYNLGVTLIEEKRFEEAIPWLEEALALNSQREEFHFSLATALIRSNRVDDARQRLGILVRLFPRSARAWLQLGRIEASNGNERGVRQYLEKAVALGGDAVRKEISTDPSFKGFDMKSWFEAKP